MRIGMITGEYPPMQGGVGAYTAILARHLAANGQEVHLFSTQGTHSPDLPLTNTLQRWDHGSLKATAAWASTTQPDVVSLQFQTAAFGMSPWIHFLPDYLRRLPVITTFHDLRFPYLFPKAGPLRDWIVMHLARASAGVIVTNHEDAARVQGLTHTRLIPIGSNILDTLPADYDPLQWRQRAGASADDFLLAFFGFINSSKGLDTLIHSLVELRSAGLPARLVIIGSLGTSDPTNAAYAQTIHGLIDQLELRPYVHQTGFLEDESEVGSYLKASDAVVLPFQDGASFRRGSLMAAIRYACPIVTTLPRVHVPEFVHGNNMLFVPPDESSALTQTLQQLYHTPAVQQQLHSGAARLAAHFDWQRIAADYIDFFTRVHEGGNS